MHLGNLLVFLCCCFNRKTWI